LKGDLASARVRADGSIPRPCRAPHALPRGLASWHDVCCLGGVGISKKVVVLLGSLLRLEPLIAGAAGWP
jgi:hypothetical protein